MFTTCPQCDGKGFGNHTTGETVICFRCGGTGKIPMDTTEIHLRKLVGILQATITEQQDTIEKLIRVSGRIEANIALLEERVRGLENFNFKEAVREALLEFGVIEGAAEDE